jgi:hypothetical protein
MTAHAFTENPGDGWPDLDRLDVDHVVGFPLDRLPRVMRDISTAAAESADVDATMAAVMAVGAVAAVCQKTAKVRGPDWVEQLSVYALVLADVSERKTTTYGHIVGPLHRIEADLDAATRDGRILRNERRESLARRIKVAQDSEAKAAKGKGDAPDVAAIAQMQGELADMGPTEERPRLVTDDATTQRLAQLMAGNGGRMAVLAPESQNLMSWSGGYSNGKADLAPLLAGYSGDPLTTDRVGRGGDRIPAPALTVVMVGQPIVLQILTNIEGAVERGLTARFIVARVETRAGRRKLRRPDGFTRLDVRDTAAGVAWEAALARLAQRQVSDTPPVLTLSPEALDRFVDWHDNDLEPERGEDGGRWSSIRGFAGKAHGLALRLAGLFHLVEHPDAGDGDEIPAATLDDAVEVVEWALAAHLAAIVDAELPVEVKRAHRLVGAARRGTLAAGASHPVPWVPFQVRDVSNYLRRKDNPVDRIAAQGVIEHLQARGYVRPVAGVSKTFEWHPDLVEGVTP